MKKLIRIVLPLIIFIVGLMGAKQLVAMRQKEEPVPPKEKALDVQILTATPKSTPITIRTTGTVKPAQQITVTPQVGGKIEDISAQLRPGGRFIKGDVIAQIENVDYKLAIEAEKSRLKQADLELQIEQERKQAAQREWELLDKQGAPSDLTLRKPQLAFAKANKSAAKASYKRAQLNVERTTITAPFNSIVQTKNIDVGQIVAANTPITTLVGTDILWVKASLPASKLPQIVIPSTTNSFGSTAQVTYKPNENVTKTITGKIVQLEAELDPQSKTASVLIEIQNPFDAEGLPILPGSFVEIYIEGKNIEEVYAIPSTALREGNHVLIADPNDKMAKKDVVVGWRLHNEVYITSGLEEGDRIITSPVSFPVYGSAVAILEPPEEAEATEENPQAIEETK